MAQIHLTLKDDQGNTTERVFVLEGKLDTLDQREQWERQILGYLWQGDVAES